IVAEDERHRREGGLIAARIKSLVGTTVESGSAARPLAYHDVVILLRDRTHAAAYETALRAADIPYVGADRGAFTRCLEIRDLVHLLTLLSSPNDDVALASVLRSPIFAATDHDLAALAAVEPTLTWYQRLLQIEGHAVDGALGRARRLLPGWKALADRIPVHDLLDRIYYEADVVARYESAAPPHLKTRVVANLHRLLTLALDVDSGRFPSLTRFLNRLAVLTADDSDAAGLLVDENRGAVRIMTIHAAKGLEAPVVFLANAAQALGPRDRGMRALVEWPTEDPCPRHFHLIGNKDTLDDVSRAVLARHELAARREEANLLYVALTRAKQALYVSGCEPNRDSTDADAARRARGWYGFIEARLEAAAERGDGASFGLRVERATGASGGANVSGAIDYGAPTPAPAVSQPAPAAPFSIDPALTQPFAPAAAARRTLAPSDAALEDDRPIADSGVEALAAAKRTGVAIHRMLELLSAPGAVDRGQIRARLAQEWR